MQKRIIGISIFIAGLFMAAVPVKADQVLRSAQVTEITGKVEWLKAGSTDWQPVSLDLQLGGGDQVRTAEASTAVLILDEGSKIDLSPGSEFTVQALTKDSQTEQLQTALAIMKGKMRAQVTPLKNASTFEVETPVMVAAVRGTIFTIVVNENGSVSITTEDGTVELIRKGQNKFKIKLGKGKEVRVEVDPKTGDVRITSVKGDFDITLPDGKVVTLKEGETIVIKGGAATFIPLGLELAQPPAADSLGEPIAGAEGEPGGDSPLDSLDEPPSGS